MKPSPFTPYCNLKVGELGIDIFPPGVFQVISGADDLGQMLTEHTGIDKISFTGSTFTGTKVMQSCSKTLKRVTLELGGNDATVVCEDADLEKAVPTIGIMAFLNAGQICMAIKRVYVHHSIYDEFKNRLVEFVRNNMKLGDPSDPNTSIGPVQNKLQYDKVKTLYEDIETSGWKPLLGAKVPKLDGENKGYFISPEIIDNPADDSRIVVEEPFGPM
jgi:acyl-CoA reductase-like NAD-dependent aldehyde dehydrogenase